MSDTAVRDEYTILQYILKSVLIDCVNLKRGPIK